MKKHITVNTFMVDQERLTLELISKFPQGAHRGTSGKIASFRLTADENDPTIQKVIDYIKNQGYELTGDCKDYSKQVLIDYKVTCEKTDLESSPFLNFYAKKQFSEGNDYLIDHRIKIDYLPPKFRYCYGYSFLITAGLAENLTKQNFKGLILLPVDYLEPLPDNQIEKYDNKRKSRELDNVYAMYSSILLPQIVRRTKNNEEVYERSQLPFLGNFDLALKNTSKEENSKIHGLVGSQRFYQFWEKNFGDVEWYPVQVEE